MTLFAFRNHHLPKLTVEYPHEGPCEEGMEERELFIDNLLVRIHFIIVMIRCTGLAPWEFEFFFSGSLTSGLWFRVSGLGSRFRGLSSGFQV